MVGHWLLKSEPSTYSIDDLKKAKRDSWDGVRNYQARNYMARDMKVGDWALFYHSNASPPGVAGLAKIAGPPRPDPSAVDPQSPYFDPRSLPHAPRWLMVDVEFVKKFSNLIPLAELRRHPELSQMKILQKGCRLSITPVTKEEFSFIKKLSLSK